MHLRPDGSIRIFIFIYFVCDASWLQLVRAVKLMCVNNMALNLIATTITVHCKGFFSLKLLVYDQAIKPVRDMHCLRQSKPILDILVPNRAD